MSNPVALANDCVQTPSGSSKDTTRKLSNCIKTAIESGANKNVRAKQVTNALESFYTDEFKKCLVNKVCITSTTKKLNSASVLTLMDEANFNTMQLKIVSRCVTFYFHSSGTLKRACMQVLCLILLTHALKLNNFSRHAKDCIGTTFFCKE